MISLTIPFVLLLLVLCIVFCLYKRKYVACGFLAIAIIVFDNLWEIFPFKVFNEIENISNEVRVLSFNINSTDKKAKKDALDIADYIIEQNADVLFLAEDFDGINNLLDSLLIKRYPYTTFHQRNQYGGHYFYSKYPLGEVEHLEIECNRFSYCFHCKMAYGNDSISLFGVHMASNNYKGTEASIRPEDIDGVKSFSNYLDNIEAASRQRCEEATIVRDMSIKLGGPSIIMGDFNDVSGSRPLNILEDAGFKDAWWEGGFGYGATIHHPLPFRIDHVMYNDGLKLVDIKKVDSNGLSDHDALVACFNVKTNMISRQ